MNGGVDLTKYEHSPVHRAVAARDHVGLRNLLSGLPRLRPGSEVLTEAASLMEEGKAEAVSEVVDRRDVPNRDTPLHLAVKLGDEEAAGLLMGAGADCSLHNEQGWSALQEAICGRAEAVAKVIVMHYHPLAWEKWCRRLPRLVGTMRRMRDFYMEITFHFESSVVPFVSHIAPSDTYRIWKRGSNLRADMTLAGFDNFHIRRSDQSVLFLGEGDPAGSLWVVSHAEREVVDALDGVGSRAAEAEARDEVESMSRTNVFRPGIDVTRAELVPLLTWRRQERSEMVGPWRAKVYDMNNVVLSIKSRRVPGVGSDEELFSPPFPEGQVSRGAENRRDGECGVRQSEFMKRLRPTIWLSQDFPLRTEELLPLLDILANKVKAIRRLREILTTTLPPGTFPVKVAIPVVATVRVVITFTKFEELEPSDEFKTPPSTPPGSPEADGDDGPISSLLNWVRPPEPSHIQDNDPDPFAIPEGYKWVSLEEAKKKKPGWSKGKGGRQ